MKEFLRSMLGSCLGVLVAFLLVILILFGIGAAFGSGSGKSTTKVADKGIIKFDFKSVIPEKSDNVSSTSMFGYGSTSAIGLREMTRLIEDASKNDEIKGIVIVQPEASMGQATLLQIRNALKDFKKSGKFIYAYSDNYDQSSYVLSSIADKVYLNPNGLVDLHGYASVIPFFKGLTDKLGVNFEVFYAGDFKSATEPFRRTDMSPENKLQTKEFLSGMLDIIQKEVSESRNISIDDLDKIMTNIEGRTADRALASKLIDGKMYWHEFEQMLAKKIGLEDEDDLNYLTLKDYKTIANLTEKGNSSKKIAVIYAEGEVSYNNKQRGVIDNKQFLKIFDKIEDDKNIKAVVLRVNSGGGSALTSDIIWREIENLKAKKIPVVASFGDYAASGGYYIAAGADKIYAAPNTLTGSIGVFSMFPNVKKLANEKLGITFDTVKTHPNATALSTVYNLSEFDKKLLKESVDDIYKTFLQRVADGRKMSVEDVHKIAQGRVWTGEKGKEIGLVDEIGFLQDAIAEAAKLAKLDDYKITEYPKFKVDFLNELANEIIANQSGEEDENLPEFKMNSQSKWIYDLYSKYKIILQSEGVQARMMYEFKF